MISNFLGTKQGEMLPVFHPIVLRLFDFLIWGSKENKIPPTISTELVKAF